MLQLHDRYAAAQDATNPARLTRPGVRDALAVITRAERLAPEAAHALLTAAHDACPSYPGVGGGVARLRLKHARDAAYVETAAGRAEELARADYLEREAAVVEKSMFRQSPRRENEARDMRHEAATIRARYETVAQQVAA